MDGHAPAQPPADPRAGSTDGSHSPPPPPAPAPPAAASSRHVDASPPAEGDRRASQPTSPASGPARRAPTPFTKTLTVIALGHAALPTTAARESPRLDTEQLARVASGSSGGSGEPRRKSRVPAAGRPSVVLPDAAAGVSADRLRRAQTTQRRSTEASPTRRPPQAARAATSASLGTPRRATDRPGDGDGHSAPRLRRLFSRRVTTHAGPTNTAAANDGEPPPPSAGLRDRIYHLFHLPPLTIDTPHADHPGPSQPPPSARRDYSAEGSQTATATLPRFGFGAPRQPSVFFGPAAGPGPRLSTPRASRPPSPHPASRPASPSPSPPPSPAPAALPAAAATAVPAGRTSPEVGPEGAEAENDAEEGAEASEEDDERSTVTTTASHSYVTESYDEESHVSESVDEEDIHVHVPAVPTDGDRPAAVDSSNLTAENLVTLARQLQLSEDEVQRMPKENVTSERLAQFLATLPNRNVHIVHDLEPAVAPPRAASPEAAAPSEPVYEDGVVIEVAKVHRPQVVHSARHHHKRHHAATGRPKRSTVKMFEKPAIREDLQGHDDPQERSASWLELFEDTLFVAVILQLAHAGVSSLSDVGRAVALFVPVWMTWSQAAFYMNQFATDDLSHRIFSYIYFLGVAGMALTIPYAFEKRSIQFVVCYMICRLVMLLKYSLVHHFVPQARNYARAHIVLHVFALLAWGLSLLIATPARVSLWYVSIFFDIALNFVISEQNRVPFSGSHLPERFGLFTLIVLGEMVISLTSAAGAEPLPSARTWVGFVLGMTTTFCLWWTYFIDFKGQAVRKTRSLSSMWLYGHLPLHLSHALLGMLLASTLLFVDDNAALPGSLQRTTLGVGAAVFVTNAFLMWVNSLAERDALDRISSWTRLGLAGILLVLIAIPPGTYHALGLMANIMAAAVLQVVIDLIIQWRRSLQDQRSMSQDGIAMNNLSCTNQHDKQAPESAPATNGASSTTSHVE